MITRKYSHPISDEEIQNTLSEKVDYPASFLQKKGTNLKIRKIILAILASIAIFFSLSIVIAVFVPGFMGIKNTGDIIGLGFLILFLLVIVFFIWKSMAKKRSAEDLVKDFYTGLGQLLYSSQRSSEVGKTVLKDNYGLLAPSAMHAVSEDDFMKLWNDEIEKVRFAVKTLDVTTCSACKKSSGGLWDTHWQYSLDDERITSHRLWMRCPECKAVYCSECLVGLPHPHQCPQCGKKLGSSLGGVGLSQNIGMETFFTNPKIKMLGGISGVMVSPKTEEAAGTFCRLVFDSKYEKFIKTGSINETTEFDLGERGRVMLEFSNVALRVGGEWRLFAASPGNVKEW